MKKIINNHKKIAYNWLPKDEKKLFNKLEDKYKDYVLSCIIDYIKKYEPNLINNH